MIDSIIEMFSYTFMQRAFIVGILISLCAALVGVSLVLRRYSMIGDGLSHVAFGSVALATILGIAPIEFSIPLVIIVSFLVLKINNNSKISGDSLIAIISASSLAIGTFLVSIKGVNIDINSYLFGSILSLDKSDMIFSVILSLFVIILYIISYNKIFAITFDDTFAKSIGINVNLYNMIFSTLCSIIVVLGMRLVGSLLISSLIIFPTLTSINIFKKFKTVVISSVIISIITFTTGLTLSYYIATPTGATIVIVNLIAFIISYIYSILFQKKK